MSYQSRKTTLQLPGGIPMPVSITGVQDSAPVVNNFCEQGHDAVAVRSTVACPTCGNADRDTWRRGVKQGDGVAWVPEEATPTQKADHSISQLTAHNREEVDALSMVVGKTYAVLPQKGSEMLYANLRAWIVANPKIAAVTTWGWTTTKTSIWVLEVSMGKILMRELAHPNDVRDIAAPTDTENAAMVGMLGQMFTPEKFDVDTYADHNAAAKSAVKTTTTVTNEEALMASLMAAVAQKAPKKTTTRKKAA